MPDNNRSRRISVVINTNGRAQSLRQTIDAFRWVDYPQFELCVVCGPTQDGTRELAADYATRGVIKVAHCDEPNLSRSRNIGISMTAGDIVAFIDDDAIPEPEWLSQIAAAYDRTNLAAAGGIVYDHTGYTHQYDYAACDRLGNAIVDMKEPLVDACFPMSSVFPYLQGTNCSFDREALVDIGGFDEEFEFYLDETDVCCRLVDAGHQIRQLPNAAVHHKYLPSAIRDSNRITTRKYQVMKSKIYFSLINNHGHFSTQDILNDSLRFIAAQQNDLDFHVNSGRLDYSVIEQFHADVEQAWRIALARGLSQERKTRPRTYFSTPLPFTAYPVLKPLEDRRTFVFLSQTYPPENIGGVSRYTHDIAHAVAVRGHIVHVLTRGEDHNRVDLESGVWVHRLVEQQHPPCILESGAIVPARISNYAFTLLSEVARIADMRPIQAIEAASWDCEGAAIVLDGRFPIAINIVTALRHWLDSHEEQKLDREWMRTFGDPMLELEARLLERSPMIVSATKAIATSVCDLYQVTLEGRIKYSPHGLRDMLSLPRRTPPAALLNSGDRLRVLFVGRLELRKGIDLLLQIVPSLLNRFPHAEFWIAGDDTLVVDGGLTAKQKFLNENSGQSFLDRVTFFGGVTDDELRWLYANCDIFTAPSRFESFGLIFVEAMMFSKPSVGANAGGVPEVLTQGVTGILVEPDDAADLERGLASLLADANLRTRLGQAGRRDFEERFEISVVAARRVALLSQIADENFSAHKTVDFEAIQI